MTTLPSHKEKLETFYVTRLMVPFTKKPCNEGGSLTGIQDPTSKEGFMLLPLLDLKQPVQPTTIVI